MRKNKKFRKNKKACQKLGRKPSLGMNRRSAAKLNDMLAKQILACEITTKAQKARVNGWRHDIRFLSSMKGLWRSIAKRRGNEDANVAFVLKSIESSVSKGHPIPLQLASFLLS